MKINVIKNSILFLIEKTDRLDLLKSEINKENYNNSNRTVDLSNVIPDQFLSILKTFTNQNNNKSFVIVTEKIDCDRDNLNLVPTIQEAIDFIDLEEMERDLNSL